MRPTKKAILKKIINCFGMKKTQLHRFLCFKEYNPICPVSPCINSIKEDICYSEKKDTFS